MRRAVIMLLVLAGLMAAPAAAESPSFIKDSASDGKGPLDVVRVALGPRKDGRLRGEITMEKAWTTADRHAASAPAGSGRPRPPRPRRLGLPAAVHEGCPGRGPAGLPRLREPVGQRRRAARPRAAR